MSVMIKAAVTSPSCFPRHPEATSTVVGLGKPTLRGVRRCPKCGTINGTRGTACKNKECRVPFSRSIATVSMMAPRKQVSEAVVVVEVPPRKVARVSPEAVRIITGNSAAAGGEQVYSVRVRDRGPDYRGFVQLPNLSTASNDGVTSAAIARCFVDTCVRFASESDEVQPHSCQHVKATLSCDVEASPLVLKNTVLNGLRVASEIKQAIWLLATESPGPLVQRISKTVMVVKCRVDQRHPLGFLHFSIAENVGGCQREYKDVCTCKEFRTSKSEKQRRCVHFYACVCAFASDEKLSKEFSNFLNSAGTAVVVAEEPIGTKSWEVFVVAPEMNSSTVITQIFKTSIGVDEVEVASSCENDDAVSAIQRTRNKRVMPANESVGGDESVLSLSFVDWLGSVTERVNQTMHYGSCGRPEPLVFLVPQPFFDCLQLRIAAGAYNNNNLDITDTEKKKRRLPKWRLPNITTVFERVDSPPLGLFTKYAWHIKSMSQVKNILDTPHIPLEIIRSFTENRDGTYEALLPKRPTDCGHSKSDSKQIAIRPIELKTFLKVGYTSAEDREPIPFIFEWIPDILPKSKIGELSLRFEYGHQRNGQMEHAHVNVK